MIRISTGRIGSGKTLVEVKRILEHPDQALLHYTNIEVDAPNTVTLRPENFVIATQIGMTREGEPKYSYRANVDFWKDLPKPLNVTLDEAHSIVNSRKSMSSINIAITNILALIRKLISSEFGAGEITFITQLPYRLDRIIRDMADEVIYNICVWRVTCRACNLRWYESSESWKHTSYCPKCSKPVIRDRHVIHSLHFKGIDDFIDWIDAGMDGRVGMETVLHNAKRYFGKYKTHQIDNMIVDL